MHKLKEWDSVHFSKSVTNDIFNLVVELISSLQNSLKSSKESLV